MEALEAGAADGLLTVFAPFLPVAEDAVEAFEAAALLTFAACFSPLLPFPAPVIRTAAARLGFRSFAAAAAFAAGAFFPCVFFFAFFPLFALVALPVLFTPFATFFPVALLLLFAAEEGTARFLLFTAFRFPPAVAFDAFFLVVAAAFVDFLARFIMRASRVGLGFTRNIPDPEDKNRKSSREQSTRRSAGACPGMVAARIKASSPDPDPSAA